MIRLTRYFPYFLIFCSIIVFLSGCSSLVQEVQKWTGNRIELIDDVTVTTDDDDWNQDDPEGKRQPETLQSPKAHMKLDKILRDEGRGKYAGEQFNKQKINEALDLLPKGLTEEKVYAYLLGLVGENYYKETDVLDEIAHSNYYQQSIYYQPKNHQANQKPPSSQKNSMNVVFLLDASNSMNHKMDGKKKINWAKEAVVKISEKLPPGTLYTFRVFGRPSHDKNTSCVDSEKKISTQLQGNYEQISKVIQTVQPVGWSPLSKALENAYSDLKKNVRQNPASQNVIFVISDNTDSCGRDPVVTSKKLNSSGVKAQIHFIGLDVSLEAEKDFKKISEISNGNFEVVRNQQELKQVVHLHTEEILRVNDPWQMKATDKITRNYVSDKTRLRHHVEKITDKVQQEYERLNEANRYIKEKQKIKDEDWFKLNDLIGERRDKVEKYADDRLKQINQKLDQEFNNQTQKIMKSWSREGKNIKELEDRKKERLKVLNESQDSSNETVQPD